MKLGKRNSNLSKNKAESIALGPAVEEGLNVMGYTGNSRIARNVLLFYL